MTAVSATPPDAELRAALFSPRSVALVGASDDPSKASSRLLPNLRAAEYPISVHVVNRRGTRLDGLPVHRSLIDLPESPDHVFVMTPASAVPSIIADAGAVGAKVVTILSGGFAETGASGRDLQQRVVEQAASASVRILGPNSLGLVNLQNSLLLTGNAVFAERGFRPGGTFVASQSGSLIGALVTRGVARDVDFSCVVSVGGEADLSTGEICSLTLDDPDVTSYLLFLETLQHADELAAFAREAARRHKPVVAYKLGRTEVTARLAASHTGALAGEDDIADAFFRAHGIARVQGLDGLLEAVPLLRRLPVSPTTSTRPPRVGVVTTTNGGATMLVDELGLRGVDVRQPTESTYALLARRGVDVAPASIVDLTLAGTRYDHMKAALDVLVEAPEFDLVVAVVGSSARTRPDLAVAPIVDSADASKIIAFIVPEAPEAVARLRRAGVPTFTSPGTCADVTVAALGRHVPTSTITVPSRRRHAATDAGSRLDEAESYRILAGTGIDAAPHLTLCTDDIAADQLPVTYPVAVKVLDAGIAHKSDVGGVVLPVVNAVELCDAVERIGARLANAGHERPLTRVLVQELVTGVAEFLVGFRIDPMVGPVVLLAAGGKHAELYRDRSVRIAPVDQQTALEMLAEVSATRMLDGWRDLPRGDKEALAAAIVKLSRLADDPRIVEAEINPLIVREAGDGVTAVDAVVIVRAD